jgi:hypothetical protein
VHEFFEAGVLPSVPFLEVVVEVLSHNTASWAILVLLVSAPIRLTGWARRSAAAAQAHIA